MYGGKENSGSDELEEINGSEVLVAVGDGLKDELVDIWSTKFDIAREGPVTIAESGLAVAVAVAVAAGSADVVETLGRFIAIETGQRLHTCRPWSQYKSTSKRLKPAKRFEKQVLKLWSS